MRIWRKNFHSWSRWHFRENDSGKITKIKNYSRGYKASHDKEQWGLGN